MGSVSITEIFQQIQSRILVAMEGVCGQNFEREHWQREGFGQGLTAWTENGPVLERGMVAFSNIQGAHLPAAATERRPESDVAGKPFSAVGVSLVFHPLNPYVPTVHMNVRTIEVHDAPPRRWFGGGMDLTPYYPFEEDVRHFHRCCRRACDMVDPALYPSFKAHCDRYFYLAHRQEQRGVGGIFYDDVEASGEALTQHVAQAFIDAYIPIVRQRKDMPFGAQERSFQAWRRSRYVEFNLLQDRGTLFGLQSGGRVDGILLSMPPKVEWRYKWHVQPGSPEEKLLTYFLKPGDWA